MSRGLSIRAAAPLAVVGVLALAGLGAAQTGTGRDLLRDWGVAAPDEPYTEISFSDPTALPRTPADGMARLRFEVRNAEGTVRDYRWTATRRTGDGPPVRATGGSFRLRDGAGTELTARVPVTCGDGRVRVEISLGGPHRAIGLWLCDGRTS